MTTTTRYPSAAFSWELAPQATVAADLQAALTTWHQDARQGVFIAGSGIVGLSLALAHLREGFKVLVHTPFKVFMPEQDAQGNLSNPDYPFDLQYYAVNYYNYAFLQRLGATHLATQRGVNLYDQLTLTAAGQDPITFHTSDLQAASTRLTNLAPQEGLPALGAFVENRTMIADLLHACQQYGEQFLLLQECKVTSSKSITTAPSDISVDEYLHLPPTNKGWRAEFDNGLILTVPYVLACDGGNSYWREQARIPRYLNPYPTKCMMIELETDAQVTAQYQHHTWQYLDPHGPKAWLPHTANHGVLCWYDQIATIDQLQALTPEQLKQRILANPELVKRLGSDITVKQYGNFKLVMTRALEYAQQNVLVFGDAAHTVTPIAGQGLNIGLQDVQCYHRLLQAQGGRLASNAQILDTVWSGYARERQFDNTLMQEFLNKLHYSYIGSHVQYKLFKQALFLGGKNSQFKAIALAYATGDRKLLHTALKVKDTLTPVAQILENFTVNVLGKALTKMNAHLQEATSTEKMTHSVVDSALAQGATLTNLATPASGSTQGATTNNAASNSTTESAAHTASASTKGQEQTQTQPRTTDDTPLAVVSKALGLPSLPLPPLPKLGNPISFLLDVVSTPVPNYDPFKDHSQEAQQRQGSTSATASATPAATTLSPEAHASQAANLDAEHDPFVDHSVAAQGANATGSTATTTTATSAASSYTPKYYHATTLLSGVKTGLEVAQTLLSTATGVKQVVDGVTGATSKANEPTAANTANSSNVATQATSTTTSTLEKVANFATSASKALEIVGKVATGVTEILSATPLAQLAPPAVQNALNKASNAANSFASNAANPGSFSSASSTATNAQSTNSARNTTTSNRVTTLTTTLATQCLTPHQVGFDPATGKLGVRK